MSTIRMSAAVVAPVAVQVLLWFAPAAAPAAARAGEPAPAQSSRLGDDRAPNPGEVMMDAALSAAARAESADPALQAWRDEVLPGIRELLAAGRDQIATAAAAARTDEGPADPDRERAANRQLEALKLDLERQVLERQLQWARTWQRADLAARLASRIAAIADAAEGMAP